MQIEVGADGDPDAVAATLRAVPGVTDVERDVIDRRLFVVTGEPDVRRRLAQALIAAGQTPWQLRDARHGPGRDLPAVLRGGGCAGANGVHECLMS